MGDTRHPTHFRLPVSHFNGLAATLPRYREAVFTAGVFSVVDTRFPTRLRRDRSTDVTVRDVPAFAYERFGNLTISGMR
jgi:hypothetical protein